jgi:chromosome segregation ATPase
MTGSVPPADPTSEDNALVRSRRRDTARRSLQVHNAIAQLRTDGAPVTVSSVARAARVHRSFIHRHSDLHAAVMKAAGQPADPVPTNSATSIASLRADLLNARAQNARLHERIRTLETRLSDDLGQAAFRTSGLGAPDDVRSLHQSLTHAQQQILELRRQLEERIDELAAARAANRELMTQLNTALALCSSSRSR